MLRASLKDPSELGTIDRAILRVSGPMESGLTSAARWVGGVWSRYVALWGVRDENQKLRDENAKLRTEVERLTQEGAHGAELESLLKLRKSLIGETVAARVVGAEASSYFRVVRVRLDRGELEVKAGMPVLASAGVVGRIQRVAGSYSDVLLASDPKSSLDVSITSADGKKQKGRGVLKGI